MFGTNETAKWLWLLAGLVVANVAYYIYENWGLVTVKVKDEPLAEVIHSIEWQAWVKIYTNLPPDSKVTMYADHVPLAEAMETLAANVDVPPPAPGQDDGTRPRRDPPGSLSGNGASTHASGFGGPNGGAGPAGGPPGAPGFGRGGGGFGRRAEWNLAFFVGPTTTQVKQEIRQFEAGDPDIDAKVYTYNSQIQMIADDTVTATPDPHAQAWPGVRPAPAPDPSATAANAASGGDAQPDPPANTPPTVQTYFADFAQAANIWIMATGSWTPEVARPPVADDSIVRAVKDFVSSEHGVVTEALVLRAGRGGPRGDALANDDAWADRTRNAINGLPADQRPAALDHLTQEVAFRKSLQSLPPDERRQKMFQHFAERMLYADRSRLSPEKRAKIYQRMITMRQAAKAQ